MEIGFECKLVWLRNSLFYHNFKHSISRAIIFSWLKWLDEKCQDISCPRSPEKHLRSLPGLFDRQPLSLVPGAGDVLESFCLSSGTLSRVPWLCGRDTPKCPRWVMDSAQSWMWWGGEALAAPAYEMISITVFLPEQQFCPLILRSMTTEPQATVWVSRRVNGALEKDPDWRPGHLEACVSITTDRSFDLGWAAPVSEPLNPSGLKVLGLFFSYNGEYCCWAKGTILSRMENIRKALDAIPLEITWPHAVLPQRAGRWSG